MKAFITGSHAYGTPGLASDIDLVVRCDEATRDKLVAALAPETAQAAAAGDYEVSQVKVGGDLTQLNLLFATTDAAYEAWRRGTEQLTAEAPVTRDRAVKVFRALRRELGVTPSPREIGEECRAEVRETRLLEGSKP